MRISRAFVIGMVCGALALGGVILAARANPKACARLARFFTPSASGGRLRHGASDGANVSASEPASGGATGKPNGAADEDSREAEDGISLEDDIALVRAWGSGRQPSQKERGRFFSAVRHWAKTDPRALLSCVSEARRFPYREMALSLPLIEISRAEPAWVADWIQQNTNPREMPNLLWTILAYNGRELPPRAVVELLTAEGLKVDARTAGFALGNLASEDPRMATEAFGRLQPELKSDAVTEMVERWAGSNFQDAWDWCLLQKDQPFAKEVSASLINACIRENPEKFAQVLGQFPDAIKQLGPHAVGQLLLADEETGLAILQQLPASARGDAVQNWAREAIAFDPEGTFSLLAATLPEKEQEQAVTNTLHSWLDFDRKAAMAWLETQKDNPQTNAIREELRAEADIYDKNSIDFSSPQPAGALEKLLPEWSSNPEVAEAGQSVLHNWAQKNPDEAAAWIGAHPEQASASACAEVARSFLSNDEEAALAWIASLPTPAQRDAGMQSAVRHWAMQGDLELAGQGVNSMNDAERRQSAAFSVFQTLQRRDPAAAARWLESQAVPREVGESWRAITKQW